MALLELSKEALLEHLVRTEDPVSIAGLPDLNALLRRHRPLPDASSALPEKILEITLNHTKQLSSKEETLSILCSYISDCSVGLADTACSIAYEICRQELRLVATLMQHCSSLPVTAEVACRFASVITKLIRVDDSAFLSCFNAGGVDFVVSLSKTDDILLQMVTLEFLAVFASTKEGLKYCFANDIPRYLLLLARGEEAGSEIFIRSSALQIFADVCHLGSQHENGAVLMSLLQDSLVDDFLGALESNLEYSDESCKVAAINAVRSFSSTSLPLLRRVLFQKRLVRIWLSLIDSKVEIQAVLISSVAHVLSHKFCMTDAASKASESELKKQLYNEMNAIKPALTSFIVSGSRRPFPEIKQACYSLQAALAGTPWGLSALFGLQDFRVNIVDLSQEQTRDGKLWKFAVIEAAAGNESLSLFSEEVVVELTRAVERGPFYVSPQLLGPVAVDR